MYFVDSGVQWQARSLAKINEYPVIVYFKNGNKIDQLLKPKSIDDVIYDTNKIKA